jgi:membrane protein YqaA with SNARE-associated domain
MRHRHAAAGALILNIPVLVAAVYLPASAAATMAVCLAALGAVLGTLAGWGIQQQPAARGAEGSLPAERPRYAEAA